MISKRENLPTPNAGRSYDRGDDWRDAASCAGLDVDLFYPDGQGHHVPEPVKRMCSSCEVRRDCLDWALETRDQFGVFGGVAPRDRRGKQPGDDVPIRLNTPDTEGLSA